MARFVTIPIGPIFSGGSCRGIIHVIEPGDTLYLLGRRYRVSVSDIMYANPFVNIYNLQVGDELCIPVGSQQGEMEENNEGQMPRPPMSTPAPTPRPPMPTPAPTPRPTPMPAPMPRMPEGMNRMSEEEF